MYFQSTRPAIFNANENVCNTKLSHTLASAWHPNNFYVRKRFIVTAFKLDYNMLICAYCVCGFCFVHRAVFSLLFVRSLSSADANSMWQSVNAFEPRFETREFISLRLMSNFTHSQSNIPLFFLFGRLPEETKYILLLFS